MSLNPLTAGSGTDVISQLVSKVLDRYDGDKDGKLTATEFGSFLTGLLSGSGAAGLTAAKVGDPGVTRGSYRSSLAGFDARKVDDPSIRDAMTSKYRAARIFQDYPPQPESIPAVIERLKAEGINAVQTDIDKIDFGDGYGPIDVIQGAYAGGGVAWQWLPRE
ncbi:MAG: hypothetical protein AB7H93_15335 [Vicinamibacterales bacterium]